MKAKPVKIIQGEGYVECPTNEATHVSMRLPGPTELLTLPVILRGMRAGTGCWTWNGDIEKPTLRPSILTHMGCDGQVVCHSWVNDGQAQFLSDCTHEFRGQTVDLLDVDNED
jgi:hypothetical protein